MNKNLPLKIMSPSPTDNQSIDQLPGHYIRRLQQIAVAIFLQETEAFSITPIQFAAMGVLNKNPHLDQKTLAQTIGQDASTIGGVIDRLETRGLVKRSPSVNDRRAHLLTLTHEGQSLLQQITPAVLKAQDRILEPLTPSDHATFLKMLDILVKGNNELSRAPTISHHT